MKHPRAAGRRPRRRGGLPGAGRLIVAAWLVGAAWIGVAVTTRPPRAVPGPLRDAATSLTDDLASAVAAAGRDAYRVAVVDMFYPGDEAFASPAGREAALIANDAVDIDGDGVLDPYYHGDIVAIYARRAGIEIVPYRVTDLATAKRQIRDRLAGIADQVERGAAIDAVILAWESSTFQSAFGEEVRPERAARYKRRIHEWGATDPSWRLTYEVIQALERLTGDGVVVFTIAGNTGSHGINAYALAEGVLAVGGAEASGEGRWFANNAFVDTVAQGVYRVDLVRDGAGRALGYDINEDGAADIPLERVSGTRPERDGGPRDAHVILKGSSFAAPTALGERMATHAVASAR